MIVVGKKYYIINDKKPKSEWKILTCVDGQHSREFDLIDENGNSYDEEWYLFDGAYLEEVEVDINNKE